MEIIIGVLLAIILGLLFYINKLIERMLLQANVPQTLHPARVSPPSTDEMAAALTAKLEKKKKLFSATIPG
jgi:hypothetical protein